MLFMTAWPCGITLGAVGMALHHKLCHTTGGAFDMPHAQIHTVVLPHALAYNAPFVLDAMTRIAQALGTANAPRALFDLPRSLGAPNWLKKLGMPRELFGGRKACSGLTPGNKYGASDQEIGAHHRIDRRQIAAVRVVIGSRHDWDECADDGLQDESCGR